VRADRRAAHVPFTHALARYWWGFLTALPLLVCLYPPMLNRLLRLGFKILRRDPPDQALSGKVIIVAMAWYIVSWVFYGLQIYVMALRVEVRPANGGLSLCIGAFALSWAIGFVTPSPAGAGFRDVLLIVLLSTQMSAHDAAAITLVSRVATIVADGITAGAAVAFYKYRHRKSLEAATTSAGQALLPLGRIRRQLVLDRGAQFQEVLTVHHSARVSCARGRGHAGSSTGHGGRTVADQTVLRHPRILPLYTHYFCSVQRMYDYQLGGRFR
jgi:Lysylphosphatidylglycerol synthase TM region